MELVNVIYWIFAAAIVLIILSYIVGITVLAFVISLIPQLIYFIAAVGIGIILIIGVTLGVKHFWKSS